MKIKVVHVQSQIIQLGNGVVIAQLGTDDGVVPYGISDERLHRNCAGMAIEIFQQREQQAAVLTVKST